MIFPGLMGLAQYSTLPLPLPCLVSSGFFVIGLSGNALIQTLPPLLIYLTKALLAASICLEVNMPWEVAFNPKSPNETVEPADAKPLFLPFICFLYFVFLGCSTFVSSINPNFNANYSISC